MPPRSRLDKHWPGLLVLAGFVSAFMTLILSPSVPTETPDVEIIPAPYPSLELVGYVVAAISIPLWISRWRPPPGTWTKIRRVSVVTAWIVFGTVGGVMAIVAASPPYDMTIDFREAPPPPPGVGDCDAMGKTIAYIVQQKESAGAPYDAGNTAFSDYRYDEAESHFKEANKRAESSWDKVSSKTKKSCMKNGAMGEFRDATKDLLSALGAAAQSADDCMDEYQGKPEDAPFSDSCRRWSHDEDVLFARLNDWEEAYNRAR